MTKGLIITLTILGVFGFFGASFVLGYFSFTSTANQYENGIEAQYSENQNTYDNGWKKVVEAAQITELQAAQLKGLYVDVLKGLKDSNAMLLALGQFNPNMDQGTHKKVQQLIEAFRNDFRERQSELIARKNEYKNYLTVNWSGRFFNMIAGYPKIDLKKFDIVTSNRTEDAFKTKRDEPLNLGPKQ
jgi:hypothetical protein